MALLSNKHLILGVFKNCYNNTLPSLYTATVRTSSNSVQSEDGNQNIKMSKAVKAYINRARNAEKKIRKETRLFNYGKKHLANIMGEDPEKMTQEDIDKSIEYLLPSGLFVPKARPMMKPPELLFPVRRAAEFDECGRPLHFLYYTTKPNFTKILHDGATLLAKANDALLDSKKRNLTPPESKFSSESPWFDKETLEGVTLEKITESNYKEFIELIKALATHPYSSVANDFLLKYCREIKDDKKELKLVTVSEENNVKTLTVKSARRAHAKAEVTVKYPGEGIIKINGFDLDYFPHLSCREQVIYPLIFTNLLGRVDVEAQVENGGISKQAGAVRLGVARAITHLIQEDVIDSMKLAGLLQVDFRRKERKKPGKRRARRGYTWLKR